MNHDPTNQLKSKTNKLVNANIADLYNIKLPKIIGDYKPWYIYRTVKTHKPGYPLQPIISQVTTPTYQFTKTINDLITPYLSHNYSIKSTKELIEILKTHIVIYKALCFDVAQGRMNGAPNETRTHSCRFASLACYPLHHHKTHKPNKGIISSLVVLCYKNLKTFKNPLINTLYTCKQPLMMAYERSESARDYFGKFIRQFQLGSKTLIRKLERIFIKL